MKNQNSDWNERWKEAWDEATTATKEFHKDFDATILAVSTGAIAFTSYITKDNQTWLLTAAILAWGTTIITLILSQALGCTVQLIQVHQRLPKGETSNTWWGVYSIWALNIITLTTTLIATALTVIGLLMLNPPNT